MALEDKFNQIEENYQDKISTWEIGNIDKKEPSKFSHTTIVYRGANKEFYHEGATVYIVNGDPKLIASETDFDTPHKEVIAPSNSFIKLEQGLVLQGTGLYTIIVFSEEQLKEDKRNTQIFGPPYAPSHLKVTLFHEDEQVSSQVDPDEKTIYKAVPLVKDIEYKLGPRNDRVSAPLAQDRILTYYAKRAIDSDTTRPTITYQGTARGALLEFTARQTF